MSCVLVGQNVAHGQWYQQRFPATETLYKVRFANASTGWVLGASGVYKTEDGGQTWAHLDSARGFGELLLPLNDRIVFYSSSTTRKPRTASGLRRSTDGGRTWQKVEASNFAYLDLDFVSDNIGYLAAADSNYANPVIMKTLDGGATWLTRAREFKPAKAEITALSFIDEQHGWAVSYDAFIFHTNDGGATWALQDSIRASNGVSFPLRRIHFTSADSGWAVGGIGGFSQIAQTIDGGKHWSVTTQTGCSLRDMVFLSSQEGRLAGTAAFPVILRTGDGGQTWTQEILQPTPVRAHGVWSLAVLDNIHGWAVGDSGRFFVIGAVVNVNDNKTNGAPPHSLQLQPAQPNPVREATRLTYELPHSAQIRLAIYDVLGREVARLFAGTKSPGVFVAAWNGRDRNGELVPNGIYFCQLKAEASTITRKLLVQR